MKTLIAFMLCLCGWSVSGQGLIRNFFTTNPAPVVDVVAGTNATAQASTPTIQTRRFTVNGVTDTNVVSIIATNVAAYQASLATNGAAYLANNQTFTGSNTFNNAYVNGNGSGLTNLNASSLASGTVPLGVLPNVLLPSGADDTFRVNSYLSNHNELVLATGTWNFTNTIIVNTQTAIKGHGRGKTILNKTTPYGPVFANKACYYHGTNGPDIAIELSDLTINIHSNDDRSMGPEFGAIGEIQLNHAANSAVKRIEIQGTGSAGLYALQAMCSTNVLLESINVLSLKDGIHISSGSRTITIRDCELVTGDDAIILAACDYPVAQGVALDIEGILISNCRLDRYPDAPSGGNITVYLGSWTTWSGGNTYNTGNLCVYGGNVYKVVSLSTNVIASSAPTGTSYGERTGADGLTWRWMQAGTNTTANVRRVVIQNIACGTNTFFSGYGNQLPYDQSVYPGTENTARLEDVYIANFGTTNVSFYGTQGAPAGPAANWFPILDGSLVAKSKLNASATIAGTLTVDGIIGTNATTTKLYLTDSKFIVTNASGFYLGTDFRSTSLHSENSAYRLMSLDTGTLYGNGLFMVNNMGIYWGGDSFISGTPDTSLYRKAAGVVGTETLNASGTIAATNGFLYQGKPSFYTDFTCTTNLQVYCCNGTNQVITLPDARYVPWSVYRFSCTNGWAKFILTNATGSQTIRDGASLSFTQIGIGSPSFISDGAHWWPAARTKVVFPAASWSCTTNIAMVNTASTSNYVTFNQLEFNNSQGIALENGQNFWITNSGEYLFTYSAVTKAGHNGDVISLWLKQNGANIARTRTDCGAQTTSVIPQTVNFILNITTPSYINLVGRASGTGCTLDVGAAADSTMPACPSVIVTINRVSDPYP